jgi:hypothetical protein
VPARFTFGDFCDQIAEDPKFARLGTQGVQAAFELTGGQGGQVLLTLRSHRIIMEVLNSPSQGFELPQGVARLAWPFYRCFEEATEVADETDSEPLK